MAEEQKTITEDDVINYIFQHLYHHLHKNEQHLEKDILQPAKLQLDEQQQEHLRELLVATSFIKSSVGFGKSGYIYLTGNGIQMMKLYGTYDNYVKTIPHQEILKNSVEQPTNTTSSALPHNANTTFNEDDMAH